MGLVEASFALFMDLSWVIQVRRELLRLRIFGNSSNFWGSTKISRRGVLSLHSGESCKRLASITAALTRISFWQDAYFGNPLSFEQFHKRHSVENPSFDLDLCFGKFLQTSRIDYSAFSDLIVKTSFLYINNVLASSANALDRLELLRTESLLSKYILAPTCVLTGSITSSHQKPLHWATACFLSSFTNT